MCSIDIKTHNFLGDFLLVSSGSTGAIIKLPDYEILIYHDGDRPHCYAPYIDSVILNIATNLLKELKIKYKPFTWEKDENIIS